MRVLVIFEMVPEETLLLQMDDPSDEQLTVLRGAAGQYINVVGCETDCVEQINDWAVVDGMFKRLDTKQVNGPFDEVVHCGFIL